MRQLTKRKILRLAFSLLGVSLFLLSLPLASYLTLRFSPSVYQETYYGEFLPKYHALEKQKEQRKIVVIGTSSVAFGLDSALVEEELAYAGFDYRCVGYGLYGALGTKLMMDTALPNIGEGDIVLLSPELYPQTLSLYFSGIETLRAIEGNQDIYSCLDNNDKGSLALAVPSFLAEKSGFLLSGTVAPSSGIYAKESFNEKGDMKEGLRPHNVMDDYWAGTPMELDMKLFSDDFIEYVHAFSRLLESKKATLRWRLPPMNRIALPTDYKASLPSFYEEAGTRLKLQGLGNPFDCVIEENYFFDSDFHLNDAGRRLNSLRLVEELKTEWGSSKPNKNAYPDKPDLPKPEKKEVFGDDSDLAKFVLSYKEGSASIVGLKEEGEKAKKLVVPTHEGDTPILYLEALAEKDCALEEIRIQRNIGYLRDGIFAHCPNLSKIILEESDPSVLHVGWSLIEESSKARIYVPRGSLSRYRSDYFWGHYSAIMEESEI